MTLLSPTGKRAVDSHGPLDAKIVFVGESPGVNEVTQGIPFVGRSGKLLDQAMRLAGIDRFNAYLMNCVPVRAPGDKFAQHDPRDIVYGRNRFNDELDKLTDARVFVALGANPLEWLLGRKPPVRGGGKGGFISEWRGSIIPAPVNGARPTLVIPETYVNGITAYSPVQNGAMILPTFHPAAVLRQFTWHPWFLMDVAKAGKIASGWNPIYKSRKWYVQDAKALQDLANSGVDLISVDSEMNPFIIAIATDDELHVFEWNEAFRAPLTQLLTSKSILKVAHNWTHDHAWFRKQFGITVQRPYFDTQGGANILNNALQKELSPHIATRYTNWPYHKYLADSDVITYCGMDAIVCYDAYWPMIDELAKRDLYDVAAHDHKLLTPLMDMQAKGFAINEADRILVATKLTAELDAANDILEQDIKPIVDAKIAKFEKPHLFQRLVKCNCCGGGKTQQQHCFACTILANNLTVWWSDNEIDLKATAKFHGFKTIKDFKQSWGICKKCSGTGKVIKDLEFNSDSPDQVADVLYRGLGIKARKFKGKETVKAANLDGIKDAHPIVAKLIEVSEIRAKLDTVSRLTAGPDGLLHCVMDPFGTSTGRIAGKGGLVELGTNPMNLPVEAREFVVPRDKDHTFLYPDMAQIEARALAVLSKDQNLINAFSVPVNWPGNPKHGLIDSHTSVVQMMMASGATITRDQAKRLVYAIMNGGRAAQLAVELNAEAFRKGAGANTLTTAQVQFMIDTFYRAYPGVKSFQVGLEDKVLTTRHLKCPFTKRERWWLGYIYDSKTKGLSYETAKEAYSFLPQNMAAWVLAEGLIDLYYNNGTYTPKDPKDPPLSIYGGLIQPLIHVHDALLLEVPIKHKFDAERIAKSRLTKTMFGITFEVGMKSGDNWLEASGG